MPARLSDAAILDRLADVFRTYGYEGASLSHLSAATGLGRASLYHRFPGGKDEMVEAVLTHIDEIFGGHVLAPIGEKGDPAARLRRVVARLDEFYESGAKSCVFDTLSLGPTDAPWRAHIARAFGAWIDAFAALSRETGLPPVRARRAGEEAVARIQGSLVMERGTRDPDGGGGGGRGGGGGAFAQAMRALPGILLEDEGGGGGR